MRLSLVRPSRSRQCVDAEGVDRLVEMRVRPLIEEPILRLRMCAQLVKEVAYLVGVRRAQTDFGAQLRETRAKMTMLVDENPRVALAKPKELRDQLGLLRVEMREKAGVELHPES